MSHPKRIREKVKPSMLRHRGVAQHTDEAAKIGLGPIPVLDIIRFTASVVVMLFHLCYWGNGNTPPASDTFNNFWWFGWVGVEIFFTLSGFVIVFSARNATAKQFAIGRLVRLLPTIWLCASITLLLTLVLSPQGATYDLFVSYLNTLWMNPRGGHIDIVYWTLTVEISFYLMVLCLLWLGNFRLLLRVLMVVGIASSTFNMAVFINESLQPVAPTLAQTLMKMNGMHTFRLLLLKHGVFFALGALLWRRLDERLHVSSSRLLLVLCLGATSEVWSHGQEHLRHLGKGDGFLIWILGIWGLGLAGIAFGASPMVTRLINAWVQPAQVRLLGLLTFPVYLLHNNGGLLVKDALQAHGLNGNLATLVAVILTVWAALMLSQHVEPILARWLKQRLAQLTG